MTGSLSIADVGLTLGKLSIFLAVVLVAGLIFVPRLIGYVAKFKSNEMLIITVLGLCFGVSLLALKLGYSVALGAFIIGAVIAESREIHRIEALVEPVRDMFSAIFFVAIGLLIQPAMLLEYWQPILLITLAVVLGKVLTCSAGAFLGGNDTRTSLHVGMSLAQIGEFSFIIASLGVTLKVTSSFLYPIAVAVSALTTLFTPYLIRAAGGLADGFQRAAPRKIANTLEVYTEWVGQLGGQRSHNLARSLLWKWAMQMGLNAVLIAGIFVAGAYLGTHPPAGLKVLGLEGETQQTAIWLVAVVLSLPFFVATAKKLQAVGWLLAEMRVSEDLAGAHTAAIRGLVATVVPIAGSAALGLFALVLSSTLLPSPKILAVLLVAIALAAWFLSRSFSKVYTSAQAALLETFDAPGHSTPPLPLNLAGSASPLLAEADLATVVIAPGARAAGQLIRELALRTRTGTSVVAFERAGHRQINPGPDEELRAGDTVLLLGTPEQIAGARSLFTDPVA